MNHYLDTPDPPLDPPAPTAAELEAWEGHQDAREAITGALGCLEDLAGFLEALCRVETLNE